MTGRVKLVKVIWSIAEVALPLNHFKPMAELENKTINITPETYSGVAVVMMEKVDRLLSVREPSRMPAITPTSKAAGTITIITQNISLPVKYNRLPIICCTLLWNSVV